MKAIILGALFGLVTLGAAQPVKQLFTQAVPFPNSVVPLFRHGYLVLFPPGAAPGTPVSAVLYGFTVYGPNGKRVYPKILRLPGGRSAFVRDVDFDMNGNAAVAASMLTGASDFLAGILLLDRRGEDAGFIDTGRYVPTRIAIAPDNTIWTLGLQLDAANPRAFDRQDYRIVRQFSAAGKELNAFLPRSSFPPGLEPGAQAPGVRIEVTSDRVGILACSGKTSANTEWIELDFNGNLLERLRADNVLPHVALAAFTADDRAYIAGFNGNVYTLDDASHTWQGIPKQGAGSFLGTDGNYLVYRSQSQETPSPIQLQWFPRP